MTESHSIETLIKIYVNTRAQSMSPVSTRECSQALRMVIPNCDLSDRDLADTIAQYALSYQCAVVFD